MAFWDNEEIQEQATIFAFDWLKQQTGVSQQPAPVSTPVQVAAQPAAVTAAQTDQSKMITYGAIGISILGIFLMLFKGK